MAERPSAPEETAAELQSLQKEVARLRAALAERDKLADTPHERLQQDLLQARRELAQARLEQERLDEELHASRAGQPIDRTKATAPGTLTANPQRRSWRVWRRRESPLQSKIARLYESNLFDADWYRAEYPDVANTGMDPAEHYLLHGAAEGRNPGPEFNTHQYLFEHPELVDSGENPLLHYLASGTMPGTR